MNMTFLGGFRMMGMPNPGNKQNGTFVADFVGTGVSTKFIKASASEPVAAESNTTPENLEKEEKALAGEAAAAAKPEEDPQPITAGTRKRRQRKVKRTHRREIFSYY